MPALVSKFLDIPFYWIRVFRSAFIATWNLIVAQPISASLAAVAIWLVFFIVHRFRFGRPAMIEEIRPAISGLIAVAIVAVAVFLCILIATPARLDEELRQRALKAEGDLSKGQAARHALEGEAARLRERNTYLVNRLPPITLTARPEQETLLKKTLEGLGPHTVSIKYLDTHESRAGSYASQLAALFRSVSWHVEMRGEVKGYEYYTGVSMNIESIDHVRPTQKAVLDALKAAEVPLTLRPGNAVADRVELIIGSM